MDRSLIKTYIDSQPMKAVIDIDLNVKSIKYDLITQWRIINEITGDEEMSRAFLITRLVNELGYPADRIEIERHYTAGRPHTNNSRIDMIVRDSGGNAFLFIECKSPEAYATEDKDQIIEEQLYKAGFADPKVEGYNSASWILLDYEDVIIHVFSKEDRLFYNLERIWRDGIEVNPEEI